MVWPFDKKRKKEEKVPELPELPELPPLPEIHPSPKISESQLPPLPAKEKKPEIKNELPPLPSFPVTRAGEQVSREIVKQAIKEPTETKEIMPRTREIENEPIQTQAKTIVQPVVKETKPEIKVEPIFVRIDKYQESIAKFQDIKKRLLEIENLLRNVKEIKAREETQLQEWQREIEEAKLKLDSIDKTIFQKLEE